MTALSGLHGDDLAPAHSSSSSWAVDGGGLGASKRRWPHWARRTSQLLGRSGVNKLCRPMDGPDVMDRCWQMMLTSGLWTVHDRALYFVLDDDDDLLRLSPRPRPRHRSLRLKPLLFFASCSRASRTSVVGISSCTCFIFHRQI